MQKRGLSPLIATVLLVAFVVILAVLVFTFARGILEQKQQKEGNIEKLHCATDIRFSIDNAITNLNTVSLTITNSGSSIGGFAFRVNGEEGTDVAIINEGVEEGSTKEISFVYDDAFTGTVNNIEVFPRISIANGAAYETCEQQSQQYNF